MGILYLLIIFVIAGLFDYLLKKKKNKSEEEEQSAGVQSTVSCSACGHVLHVIEDASRYGFYGRPFRTCPNCHTEYYDRYYHELAIVPYSEVRKIYSCEAVSESAEHEASKRRLEAPGYAAKLYEHLDPSDIKTKSVLHSIIRGQAKRYVDILTEKIGSPLPTFKMNGFSDLIDKLTYEAHDENAVRNVVSCVLKHYGILPHIYQIQVEYKSACTTDRPGVRGSFTRGSIIGGVIRIIIEPSYSEYDTIISIALHECAHAFLALKGVSLNDEAENERLTDAAVCFLGGKNYILRGYFPSSGLRLGYLRKVECEAVAELVKQLTASQNEKMREENKQLLSAWQEVQKNLKASIYIIENGKQTLHPAGLVREASIKSQFQRNSDEIDRYIAEAKSLNQKLTDGVNVSGKVLREGIERASKLEKAMQAFITELREWQAVENWQANMPQNVMDTMQGMEILAENQNPFAILERIRFWAMCSATGQDAQIYYEKLKENETADSLYALGVCCREGLVIPKDEDLALKHFERSAALGSKDAAQILNDRP